MYGGPFVPTRIEPSEVARFEPSWRGMRFRSSTCASRTRACGTTGCSTARKARRDLHSPSSFVIWVHRTHSRPSWSACVWRLPRPRDCSLRPSRGSRRAPSDDRPRSPATGTLPSSTAKARNAVALMAHPAPLEAGEVNHPEPVLARGGKWLPLRASARTTDRWIGRRAWPAADGTAGWPRGVPGPRSTTRAPSPRTHRSRDGAARSWRRSARWRRTMRTSGGG
jgi:hypothetical protein